MAYTVKINSISTDGTSLFVNASVSDGPTTFPDITPSFSVEDTAANIDTYMQAIADGAPVLAAGIAQLVGKTYTEA